MGFALRNLSFWTRSIRHIGIYFCTSSPVAKTEFWRYVSGYGYRQVLTSFSEGYWPVSFVAQVGERQYSYSPRGDFVLFLNGLPFFVIEYCSDRRDETDRNRLLLQTGLYVRIMNHLKGGDQVEFKSFIMMVVYITSQSAAERYFVYQPERDGPKVRIYLAVDLCGSLFFTFRLNMSRIHSTSTPPSRRSSSFSNSITCSRPCPSTPSSLVSLLAYFLYK